MLGGLGGIGEYGVCLWSGWGRTWLGKKYGIMRNYKIVVVCSDATTYSVETSCSTRKEAEAFKKGVESVYKKLGKNIYLARVEIIKK